MWDSLSLRTLTGNPIDIYQRNCEKRWEVNFTQINFGLNITYKEKYQMPLKVSPRHKIFLCKNSLK